MSTRDLNWLKFGALVTLAFVLGLFVAGLLDFPRTGLAQGGGQSRPPLVKVEAPRLPSVKTLSDVSDAFASIVEAVRPSVVFIEVDRPAGPQPQVIGQIIPRLQPRPQPGDRPEFDRSSGSGFIVSGDGYILTNNHVIQGATKVKVHLLNGRSYVARVVGSDIDTDVGVLKIDAGGLTPAALGESNDVRVGEWVLAIGNPLGAGLTFSVTSGIVSAKGRGAESLGGGGTTGERDKVIQDFIQTDAVINRGSSGGPLINVRGEVIGINAAIASYTGAYQGYAFAVPIDLARNVMQQIIEHGRVERAGLRILVTEVTAEDAAYVGLDSIAGVKLDNFPEGEESPAQKAGMKPGDVITSIDGQPVRYVAQLQQVVAFRHPGETVRVEVMRGDGKHDFTVRLAGVAGSATPNAPAAPEPAATKGAPDTGKNQLGLTVEPLTPTLAAQSFLPQGTKGLLIRSIRQGAPAEDKLCPADACARPADVITEVEGKPVRSEAELRDALNGGRHGIVTLTVVARSDRTRAASSRIVRLRTGGN